MLCHDDHIQGASGGKESSPLVVHDHHAVANQLLKGSTCINGLKLCPAPEGRSAGLQERVLLRKAEL